MTGPGDEDAPDGEASVRLESRGSPGADGPDDAGDRPRSLYGSERAEAAQRGAFTGGEVPVAVYGLGKMGLPLAAVYADVTGDVTGVDVDESVVRSVNAGECHVAREPGLPELVADVVDRGALRAVDDPAAGAARASLHVLMVPTLLTEDRDPDLSILEVVARDVGRELDPGDQVIVESTVPPGTCRDVIVPALSAESGLSVGEFGVACCPERTVSGQAIADIRGTHPKVVGGVDAESARVARLVYDEITDNEVIVAADATTAEAVKVFEGVYRDVNIALANQLALYAPAMGIDVTEAIDVANTQPFCEIHDPGAGVGGHCIPVYPYFLINGFDVDAPVLEVARETNDGMPAHTVSLVEAALEREGTAVDGARVLLLGATYKENVAELRNAPSIAIADELRERGATVLVTDPLVEDWSAFGDARVVAIDRLPDPTVDAVVLVTPHDDVVSLDLDGFEAPVIDGRGVVDADETDSPVYAIGGRWP